jgi:hypothetical protein
MAFEKSRLTDRASVDKALAGVDYQRSHGADFSHWFKPFTTDMSASGAPNYSRSLYTLPGVVSSGLVFAGADSSGLNPYGPNTLGEGLLFGTRSLANSGIDIRIDQNSVRTLGLKNPLTLVGWGYDIFGYPTPNGNFNWGASGTWGSASPAETFRSSGSNVVNHGSQVPYSMWEAAPLDLRFDPHRKIWTSPQSVYSARIKRAYQGTGVITDFATAISSTDVTYDAEIFDGVANRITVTGVQPVNFRPSYYIHPISSGNFCFIVHTYSGSRPRFGVFALETPGLYSCDDQLAGESFTTLSESFMSSLLGSPLEPEYGGTGFDDYAANTLLVGDPAGSGVLRKLSIVSGTGVTVIASGTTITFQLSTGVLFTAGGVNNSITELQGLTTPLSLAQGGIGSSGKNFVDLSTNQLVGGMKTFASGITIATGVVNSPSLKIEGQTKTGLYGLPLGIGISSSGNPVIGMMPTYSNIYGEVRILGTYSSPEAENNSLYAPLVVSQFTNGGNTIQIWKDVYGTGVSNLDSYGKMTSRILAVTGMTTLMANSGSYNLVDIFNSQPSFTGLTISARNSTSGVYFSVNKNGESMTLGASGNATTITSTSGTRTIHLSSGYHGDIAVAKVGGGTRTLHLMHGLIVGYTDS